jgi:hypothetical protein
MRYRFEVRRLTALPIQDYSELEETLRESDIHGWDLLSTFESYDSFEPDFGPREEGNYLFGVFRRAEGWPSDEVTEIEQTLMREIREIKKLLIGPNMLEEWELVKAMMAKAKVDEG